MSGNVRGGGDEGTQYSLDGDRTIATWQSLIQNDRIQSYKPEYHGLVIFDEAHHSPAPR